MRNMRVIPVPSNYDYVAVYLTDRCPLRCSYCITEHNAAKFISGKNPTALLTATAWARELNSLALPAGVPITLQGGEPLVFPGIWDLLENLHADTDILTALPKSATPSKWLGLSKAARLRLNRKTLYPNIRVSYHVGQNQIEHLVEQVRELQEFLSIGIYGIEHPAQKAEIEHARRLCEHSGVFFKTKEFLGYYNGVLYGNYKYPSAVTGAKQERMVLCKNSVLILGPDGQAYRCHSDLYHHRRNLAIGNITDVDFKIEDQFRSCNAFGLCSECDVKIKTNHLQQFGYTSVTIKFEKNMTEDLPLFAPI